MQTTTILTPIAASERIQAMDVLRGFALLGILLMNIEGMVGPLMASTTGINPALTGADRWADALIFVFIQGKFYTLFSLLFGMGFAVMMARAQASQRPFTLLYLRRTLALLGIGLAHALLVWSGDILTTYALLALVLLLFRDTPQSRLPKWGVGLYLLPVLMIGAAGVLGSLMQLEPTAAAEMDKAMEAQGQAMAEVIRAQRETFGAGSYLEAVGQRLQDVKLFLGYILVMGTQILGMFLIGAWFVRSGAIARPAEFPRLYARLRWVAWPAGLAMVLIGAWLLPTNDFARMDLGWGVANALAMLGSLLMCLGYAAWVVRGLQSPMWSSLLGALAPAGQMALTHYLLQSIVCTLIFYGYGLGYFEQLPRAWQVPFVVVFFSLQVLLSRWWLSRFRFGPAEWVWRALTYGRRPAMRAGTAAA